MVTRRSGQPRSGSAISAAVEVISDRWSPTVTSPSRTPAVVTGLMIAVPVR
jgi:hypothetical protein